MNRKIYKSILLSLIIVCFLNIIASASFAYFTSNLRIKGYTNVKIELLFERYDKTALEEYQSGFENLTEEDKLWGHKGNPYLISEEKHIYNLSVLQNNGYFYKNFIKNNFDENGALVGNADCSDGYEVPYFVLADTDGKPIVIDASSRVIKPVGNERYPFIGSIVGASSSDAPVSFSADGKQMSTTTSAIHGVTVQTTKSSIDYGFFGKISYLGVEPVIDETVEFQTFEGYASNISNILFSDVKIKIVSTIWEDIVDYFVNHLFYKNTFGVTEEADPCETHHIGIIAGHVEYANMSALSVYYSSEGILAIDLQDAGKDGEGNPFNYASATGHIGFMYSLNPVVENGLITVGSGLDSADISYGFQGGGGLASGILPGYIRAEQIYEEYSYYAVENNGVISYVKQDTDKLNLIEAYDETGIPLATPVENNTSTNYFFTDGVFTFAFSSGQNTDDANSLDTIEDIWKPNQDGVTKIDKINLTKSKWEIGQGPEGLYYYQELQLITSVSDINSSSDYLIGYLERSDGETSETGKLYFMNILTSGTTINAPNRTVKLMPTISGASNSIGIRYQTEPNRKEDEGYAVNFTQNTDGTYRIGSKEKNGTINYLGVMRYIGFINQLYCGKITDGNFLQSYNFNVSMNYDAGEKSWVLSIDGSNVGFDKNSAKFTTSIVGEGESAPIQIYKILPKGSDNGERNEAPYEYVPKGDTISLNANQYVFRPTADSETSGDDYNTATKYEVLSLENLGWKSDENEKLWAVDENGNSVIKKMVNIKQSVDWSLAFNIGNWGFDFGSGGGTIVAPVGSGSYERSVYIPTGALAFNINKANSGAKIRVIVKIPHSTEVGGLNFDGGDGNDHYLGIWQGKEKSSTSNSSISYASFNIDDAYKKVELPRSQKLIVGDDTSSYYLNGVSSDTQYLSVIYNGEEYITMLQGGYYLMAYEFEVPDTGIYILAATDVNMQLVYCRVDGVASSGRDGTGGTPLGNIDFVYDNGEKVLLVTDGGTTAEGGEDPTNYYYESFVLMHFVNVDDDGNKHIINSETFSVYRWMGGDGEIKTNINLEVTSGSGDCPQTDCEHIVCSPIKSTTDNITVNYTKKE